MVENTKWMDTYLFEKYVARWRGNENILSQFYIIALIYIRYTYVVNTIHKIVYKNDNIWS